jgi:hypothetical protein
MWVEITSVAFADELVGGSGSHWSVGHMTTIHTLSKKHASRRPWVFLASYHDIMTNDVHPAQLADLNEQHNSLTSILYRIPEELIVKILSILQDLSVGGNQFGILDWACMA